MFLSYLWCSSDIDLSLAHHEFGRILEAQREMYSSAWGFPTELRIHRQGNIFVGHLTIESGIIDWDSWSESNANGIAWNGVCENFLGTRFSEREIQDVYDQLSHSASNICDWDGNFSVISWSKASDKVYLTTGATASPTMWCTKGPHGWAAGSKAAPILEMVGRDKQLSTAACSIFMAYGYNYTNQSLFEHVRRIPQRTQVTVQPHKEPKLSRYVTICDFTAPFQHRTKRNEILTSCGDRLVERIQRQLQYSSDPAILITGGRDSRCIAAAASKVGYKGPLSTGGSADSRDVIIGKQVARRLGMPHLHTPDRVPMDVFGKSVDRLRLWSGMSEGVEVIRHALAYNDFVENRQPKATRQQLFHGLGGEICRGYYYHNSEDIEPFKSTDYSIGRKTLISAANPEVPLTRDAKDLLEARIDDFSQDFGGTHATVAQWLDMFFWQNSCLRWGCDMLSVKNSMYWVWIPLLDRKLISSYWNLDLEDKRSNRFIQDLTLTLAGKLEGQEYDVAADQVYGKRSIYSRLLAKLKQPRRNTFSFKEKNLNTIQFWENILLNARTPIWTSCLDETMVRNLIRENPSSEMLWNAATIQLLYDYHGK